MASQANSIKHLEKSEYTSFWNYSKKLTRKKHSQAHSIRPPSHWYQNQTNIQPKKKVQADERRLNNPQQKTSKLDFADGPVVKNSPASAEDTSLIPAMGRFHMLGGN